MDEKKISALEEQLALLSNELKNLREQTKEEEKSNDYQKDEMYPMWNEEFGQLQEKLVQHMMKLADKYQMFLATCLTATSFSGQGNSAGSSFCNSLDCISEDGLSAALEPFSNPRRITILKTLIEQPLTPNEIAKKTGLIGGQLYHHLTNLEKAGLITKNKDKYYADGYTQAILSGLIAAIGGTKIAKNEYANELD